MSELAIVTSDIHIHNYKQFNQDGRRLKNGIAYLDYLFNFADVNAIKYVFLPGDLYNLMQILSTEVEDAIIKCLQKNFKRYPLLQIIAISGNHDQATKNLIDNPATSALQHLAVVFDNFILLDNRSRAFKTEHDHYIFGIPYYEHPEHFQKALTEAYAVLEGMEHPSAYLLMHQVVASGLPIEDHIQSDDPLFDNFQMVFNGHIHNCEEITDKFINVGSPMHRDLGDLGKHKGFWVLDLDDPNTISFKDTTDKFPQFIRKEEGTELDKWESQQYVVWTPVVNTKTLKQREMLNNFRTDLAPETIMKNYAKVIKLDEETLDYGLKLILGIANTGIIANKGDINFLGVQAEGFRSIVNLLRFNLDRPGLNLIKGTNGVGKTTLFEAVVWCIFGINLKDTKLEAVASWEEIRPLNWKGTRVMVYFNVNGDSYSIIRHLSYKGETNGLRGNDTLMLWKNDEQLFPGINKDETQEKINRLIGTDPKTFMNSIMFGQRMARLITQDNKDKRALFEELFDVEWVAIAKKGAELDFSEKYQELNKLIYDADRIDREINGAEEVLKRDTQLLSDWSINQSAKIKKSEDNIAVLESSIKEQKVQKTQLSELIPYDKEKHDEVEKKYKAAYEVQQTHLSLLRELSDKIKEINNDQKFDQAEAARLISLKEKTQKRIDEAKIVVEEAVAKSICPTCQQTIKGKQKDNIKNAFSTESLELEITNCDNELKLLDEKLNTYINLLVKTNELFTKESYDAQIHATEYGNLKKSYEELNLVEEKVQDNVEKISYIEGQINKGVALINREKEIIAALKAEQSPKVDLKAQQDAIDLKIVQLGQIQGSIEDLTKEKDIIKWWSEKGFGVGGIKAFIFNAMLAQLNEGTRKYGERLGVSLEFTIDLTKASKPFTTICSLGTKLNKDYKDFSGGEKQRLDIVLIFAMYDLISINTNFNILIMDEVFEGLDEDGENAVFDLIRMKADEGKSVYVISHSALLDSLYANTVHFRNENNNTLILN